MRDLYLENERLKEVVARGRNRIKALTEQIEELKNSKKYFVSTVIDPIPDDIYEAKKKAISKCIYQKHFCDGTPNGSVTRIQEKMPPCPIRHTCEAKKIDLFPKLDKNK